MRPGVGVISPAFSQRSYRCIYPQHGLFMTPLAMATNSGSESGGTLCKLNYRATYFRKAFDTLNLQRVKTFSVPPVSRCAEAGALGACGGKRKRGRKISVCVMVDGFLHQAGMTAARRWHAALAMKGVAMTVCQPCPPGEPCITDVCAAVAQLREGGVRRRSGRLAAVPVLDAAKRSLLVTN